MKTPVTTLAALLAFTLSAAAQSSAGSSGTARVGGVTAPAPTPAGSLTGTTTVVARQTQLFRQLDANSDGVLSQEEFARMPLLNDMDGAATATQTTTTTTGTTTIVEPAPVRTRVITSGGGPTTTTLTTTSSTGEPNSITRPTTNTTPASPPTPEPNIKIIPAPAPGSENRTGTGRGAGAIPR